MAVMKERKEAGAWKKFCLLMKKNFLQQWRHRIQTFVEVLLPVATLSLVILLRSQIEPEVRDVLKYPPLSAHSLRSSRSILATLNITPINIAYSPESELLDDVVRTSVARLILLNIRDVLPNIIPDEIDIPSVDPNVLLQILKRLINVTAYGNSTSLRGIYAEEEATRTVLAAVEFDDSLFGTTELPLNLSYALRFPERPRLNSFYQQGGMTWRTELLFPVFDMPGPRFPWSWQGGNDPGYVNEMFIALQQVLSTELISRLTGQDLSNFTTHIQRYPHPSYVEDLAVEAMQVLFPMFIMLSFSYTAVNIVRAIVVEKEMQLKETMKIMGLPSWLHWTAWFCKQFIYFLIASVLILIILKVNMFTTEEGYTGYAVLTNTPWSVLFFFLMLYLTCTIFFCFMLSSFFSKASTAALFTGLIWFLTFVPSFLLSLDVRMSTAVQVVTCLSINSAMSYGFQLMIAQESTGGLQWGEFWESPATETSRFLFGHVVVMLVVDCFVYMLIALYMEQVLPGPFGTPKPWNFFLQKTFWFPNRQSGQVLIENTTQNEPKDITKEKDPVGLPVGVKISNLTKVYGNHIAVNGLSLNIYDDQITVLLGHNGAGKSTTISMLTGNLEITRGSVTVAGYDITSQTRLARGHIGLCPQHNVLFNELTVREHLEFFARLKGFEGKELDEEIDSLITKLELDDKRDYQARGLSGGQKRRLSVGIALSGAARVVLLDEPTSGMDPASRRALWDLLQKEKKDRSMILTTHFMDEADILGDRVAIMANGSLQCVGSPYFLKRHYGAGYTLVVVKKKGFQLEACTNLIKRYMPTTTIKEDRGTEVSYSLGLEYSHLFEAMLSELEANIESINFKNYGLVATTLEDVFMTVGSDVGPTADLDDNATTSEFSSGDTLPGDFNYSLEELDVDNRGKVTGIRLIWQHMCAIWMKLFLVWCRSWPLLFLMVLAPLLQMNATLGIMQYVVSHIEGITRRELTLREGFSNTETLLSFNGTLTSSIGRLAMNAYQSIFMSADLATMDLTVVNNETIENYYLQRTEDPIEMRVLRTRMLIGATFDDNGVTAWFSNFGYHDVANSLASVHEAVLKAFKPEASFTVYNHPLEATYANQRNLQVMVALMSMQLAQGIGGSIGIAVAVFIMFYIKERVSRAKLLQKAAGIQPVVMWVSAAIFDWLLLCAVCVLIIISCLAFNIVGLSTGEELGRAYLCIIVCAAAMLPINYVFSYFFKAPTVGFMSMFFLNVLMGLLASQIVNALESLEKTALMAEILDNIFQFFPLYSLVTVIRLQTQSALLVNSCLQACDVLAELLPGANCTMQYICENVSRQCCVEEFSYWDWQPPGVMRYITFMIVTWALMWAILMIAEYRLLQKVFNRQKKAPPLDEDKLDEDVLEEAKHAECAGKGEGGGISLTAQGLTKYYGKHLAVDQVSFTVGDTECFGLLGVNGAGKTTTFKMLMGDESISSGDAFVSGHSVKTNITRVHEQIGYCPQFDAVFPELTGRETLRLFSRLRALPDEQWALQSLALAHALGFAKHLDKQVSAYSGGNKRKLSTAVSLLGRTRLVFVDEPTTGVDPAAKRRVWQALQSVRRAGRGVVLTSHSMEECEALCSRLTIMVNGRFQCLGTPQHLKNKFSQGFTLIIKMRVDNATNTVPQETSDAVKNYVSSNFESAKIMEEYQGLLTYYLSDTSMPWSRMFGIMERAKRQVDVEAYTISQTTLEQIFLQFTKYQREER